MQDFKFQVLNSEDDLEEYRLRTAAAVDVMLPMEYLNQARVIGLKHPRTGSIEGGFTMAYRGPLRCLEQLPEVVQTTHPFLQKHKENCFEINGLWLNHKKVAKSSRFHLYLTAIREASRLSLLGKTKYVYAYCADNPKLREFYRNFNSLEIYEGPIKPLPGMTKVGRERVEMGCMKRLPLTVARNPQFLVKRALGSSYQSWLKSMSELVSSRGKIARG